MSYCSRLIRRCAYIKDRYGECILCALVWLLFYILQTCGLEYLNTTIFNNPLQGFGLPTKIRFVIYFLLLLTPNVLFAQHMMTFVCRQQKETVAVTRKFLKMAIRERHLIWFYLTKFSIAILINRERLFIWATPAQYMKLHTAAATLARRYYYSFSNTSDVISKVLRDYGGTDYCNQVKNIPLVKGERYIATSDSNNNDMLAYNDFKKITNLTLSYVPQSKVENIPDFSSFDAGDKFINLKMYDGDADDVRELFKRLSDFSPEKKELIRKQLNKIRFRVHIEIAPWSGNTREEPQLDWLRNGLCELRKHKQNQLDNLK